MKSFNLRQFGYRQQLKRSLSTWQLFAVGLNYMIPLSPAIFFGFVLDQSGGTVALPFIIGGVAIFFTALSYSIMVQHFPLAGSLYNFIGRSWNQNMGFLAGWIMLLDYLFITTVTSMSASIYIIKLVHLPYLLVLFTFILITGVINIFGITFVAWASLILLLTSELVVLGSFIVWSHSIVLTHHTFFALFNLNAFHFSNIHSLMNATSLAVASYLGFDAISTLAEEAKNPLKSVPKAMYFCVFIGGIGMVLTGYLGVLACPNWSSLIHNPDWQTAALFYISKQTGGQHFATIYSLGFILSMAVFNIVATATTARVLFGVGRDGMIFKRFFSAIHPYWKTPHWNITFVMTLSLIVGSLSRVDIIANLVNYGALLGFTVLNLSVIRMYFKNKNQLIYTTPTQNFLRYCLFPLMGCIVVAWVFLSLNSLTLFWGTTWLICGIIYLALKALMHSLKEMTTVSR